MKTPLDRLRESIDAAKNDLHGSDKITLHTSDAEIILALASKRPATLRYNFHRGGPRNVVLMPFAIDYGPTPRTRGKSAWHVLAFNIEREGKIGFFLLDQFVGSPT